MRSRALLFSIFILFLFQIQAQDSFLFEKESHDFGEIKEDGGYAETTFSFINQSESPIKITNVRASCGCTTPGWTKEEVQPGDSGFVQARYNPRNRPGRFRKSLTVTYSTQGVNRTKALHISGMVKPKPKNAEEEFTIAAGNLRSKVRSFNMGRITTEKIVKKEFEVYNSGNEEISLRANLMEIPGHISLQLIPSQLPPKSKGTLEISYDPIKKNDLGFVSDNITIQTDSAVTQKNQFNIVTTIQEFFPEMSVEELDKAPKLEIAERVFDFGKIESGEEVTAEFVLKNSGKQTLNFRKIKSNCSCVQYEIKSDRIKKGKEQSLKLTFDTRGRRGNQYKTVTIFSNDPLAPTQMITIKGTVKLVADEN
jgi:hypothetical protein